MSQIAETLAFKADEKGRITEWNGEPIPSGIIKILSDVDVTERAPLMNSSWVMAGAYDFARRVGVPATVVDDQPERVEEKS